MPIHWPTTLYLFEWIMGRCLWLDGGVKRAEFQMPSHIMPTWQQTSAVPNCYRADTDTESPSGSRIMYTTKCKSQILKHTDGHVSKIWCEGLTAYNNFVTRTEVEMHQYMVSWQVTLLRAAKKDKKRRGAGSSGV